LVEEDAEMTPRQKCHKLWHYFRVRPRFSQRTHILQVARTKALDSGELDLEIVTEPIDYAGAPTFCSLPSQDVSADGPVEQDQFPADSKGSSGLGILNAALELLQQFGVARGWLERFFHEISLAIFAQPLEKV
jgi:hypothetical protein